MLTERYIVNGKVQHEGTNQITQLKLAIFPRRIPQNERVFYPVSSFYLSQAVLDFNQIFLGMGSFP